MVTLSLMMNSCLEPLPQVLRLRVGIREIHGISGARKDISRTPAAVSLHVTIGTGWRRIRSC